MIFSRMKLFDKNCCFGCKVKTGALVICYLTLIEAIVAILNNLSQIAPDLGENKFISDDYKRKLTLLGVTTIVIVSHALWGIYKSKPSYMIPFLIYKLIVLFILTMMLGFAPAIVDELKYALSAYGKSDQDVLPCFIIIILLTIGVEAYCLLILFSHYQNLRQAAFAQQVQIPAVMRFSGVTPVEPEAAAAGPYSASLYGEDLPKKSPPPPYAV